MHYIFSINPLIEALDEDFIKFFSQDKDGFLFAVNKNHVEFDYIDSHDYFVCVSGDIEKNQRTIYSKDIVSYLTGCENYKSFFRDLNGQFIVIIYDKKRGQVTLVRDKRGFKTCYYKNENNSLYISEDPVCVKRLSKSKFDKNNLAFFICSHYSRFWGRKQSFFQGIFQIEPANIICFSDSTVVSEKYWSFEFENSEIISNFSDASNLLEKNLHKSMQNILDKVDDESTILALSGGMDSTVVAALANNLKRPLNSFTAQYQENLEINEVKLAEEVAKKHTRSWRPINVNAEDFLQHLDSVYDWLKIPAASSSIVGYDLIFSKVKDLGFNNIILGGSSDNLFNGNHPDFLYYLSDLYEGSDKKFSHELNCWIKLHHTNQFKKDPSVFNSFYSCNLNHQNKNLRVIPRIISGEFLRSEALNYLQDYLEIYEFQSTGSYLSTYAAYSHWYSAVQPMITGMDATALNLNIKYHDPYLSQFLHNLTWNFSPELKIRDGINKYILRKTFDDILPESIIRRHTKVGFDVPFSSWMKTEMYKEFLIQNLKNTSSNISFYFDIEKIIDSIVKSDFSTLDPMFMWQLINANLWERAYAN